MTEDTTPEYIDDLDEQYLHGTGPWLHWKNQKEFQARLRVLQTFEKDCETLKKIFANLWHNCDRLNEKIKAAFLKAEMLTAYPDYLLNVKRQRHLTTLIRWMAAAGHPLVPPENCPYVRAYEISICGPADTFDVFEACVTACRKNY